MDILIDVNILIGVGVIVLILSIMSYFGLNFYFTVNKQAPSIIVFRKAYRGNKRVIEIEDGAGNISHFVGEKNKKWDVEYNRKDFGLKIDPMYSTIAPNERLPNGVSIYRYRINLHFPVDVRGAHGLISLVRYIRTSPDYKILDVIKDDMTLIELIDMESNDLKESLELKMKEFDPYFDVEEEEARLNEMMAAIESIKAELPTLNIKSERLSIADALKLVPTAFTSQDMNKVIQLIEFRTRQESGFEETKVLTYAIAAAIIFSAIGLIIYILSTQT